MSELIEGMNAESIELEVSSIYVDGVQFFQREQLGEIKEWLAVKGPLPVVMYRDGKKTHWTLEGIDAVTGIWHLVPNENEGAE